MNKILLALFFLPSIALAEKRIVTAVYVRHPDPVLEQLTIPEAKQAIVGANRLFRELQLKIQIRGVLRIEEDPFPELSVIGATQRAQRLSRLNSYFKRLRGRKAHAIHFITSPLVGPGGNYIAGNAYECTNKTRISGSVSNLKTGRLLEAATTIAHEVGHTFGAGHYDKEPNIMHSAANAYLPHSFRWNHWVTQGDIRFCQSIVGR